ncbi:DNA-binding protein H-NS [Aeromonas sp. RU39B]|uniref:H-NS family histone-like protein n=1 Tax=Aeromonas sp. RU39B TaxID=1907416 RepID=UPI00095548B2|nr:H-NS family nucleoid-associated regulatory protein [Aeromonas sp. RU39B]SIQ70622.1 DNA-binding protein H-NS [Aeromonas sp. RU39B]
MSDFLKVILNIRSLRAALRELTFEQLKEAKEKFDAVYEERVSAAEMESKEQAERFAKLAEFQAMLQDAGIDPSELVSTVPGASKETGAKRAPRPPKYKYLDDGVEKFWTGQGRMPKVISNALAVGDSLDSFLI